MTIPVLLPDVPAIPPDLRGTTYIVRELLTPGHANPKLAKSDRAGLPYRTWGLSLAPAKESGREMCPSRSPGCTEACLYHQGRGQCPSIRVARIARTVAYTRHRKAFMKKLRQEMEVIDRRAQREEFTPCLRLNLYSDQCWEKVAPWIWTDFPHFQGYEYTKLISRMLRWCAGKLPPNYHLTFSRSEENEKDCRRVLRAGGNVAVVFVGDSPTEWMGYPVVGGDDDDLRFLDGEVGPVVIGLKAKGMARHDQSGFVVSLPVCA